MVRELQGVGSSPISPTAIRSPDTCDVTPVSIGCRLAANLPSSTLPGHHQGTINPLWLTHYADFEDCFCQRSYRPNSPSSSQCEVLFSRPGTWARRPYSGGVRPTFPSRAKDSSVSILEMRKPYEKERASINGATRTATVSLQRSKSALGTAFWRRRGDKGMSVASRHGGRQRRLGVNAHLQAPDRRASPGRPGSTPRSDGCAATTTMSTATPRTTRQHAERAQAVHPQRQQRNHLRALDHAVRKYRDNRGCDRGISIAESVRGGGARVRRVCIDQNAYASPKRLPCKKAFMTESRDGSR